MIVPLQARMQKIRVILRAALQSKNRGANQEREDGLRNGTRKNAAAEICHIQRRNDSNVICLLRTKEMRHSDTFSGSRNGLAGTFYPGNADPPSIATMPARGSM